MRKSFLEKVKVYLNHRPGVTGTNYCPYRGLVARIKKGERRFVILVSWERADFGSGDLIVIRAFGRGRKEVCDPWIWLHRDPADMSLLENFIRGVERYLV